MKQLTIRLNDEAYEVLTIMAERTAIPPATLARSWLTEKATEVGLMMPAAVRKSTPNRKESAAPNYGTRSPEGTRSERRAKQRKKG